MDHDLVFTAPIILVIQPHPFAVKICGTASPFLVIGPDPCQKSQLIFSMDIGQSSAENASTAGDGGTTVEIKIKTLDAQSYTLRVEKNTPVPALKDQIANVVGVPVENQRLICRGKVLKDDQVLSAYNVEDGHTLHLVARQPPQPPPISTGQEAGAGASGPSDMVIVSPRNRSGHVSHSLLMGTINIPDTGEGGIPDLNRIISAVLNSVGISNAVPATAGTGNGGTVTVGVLPTRAPQATGSDGQPRSGPTDVRAQTGTPPGFENGMPRELEATLQIDALYGSSPQGMFNGAGSNAPSPFRIIQQPMVVPDALATMSQYLDRLEQSFSITEGGTGQNVEGTSGNEGTDHAQTGVGQTSVSQTVPARPAIAPTAQSEGHSVPATLPSSNNERSDTGASAGPPAPTRRLPPPQALGAIVQRVQTLLSGLAGSALGRLATQLENEPNLLDPAARAEVQTAAVRDGHMMQNLGALLLELGRTTLTMRMGQSPMESVVNAGPAVFISPSGPNPMMVQSVPLQTGVALGALPAGTSQPSGGIVGPTLGPRSINIHIHTSDLRLPSGAPSPSPSPSSSQRPPPRAVAGGTSGGPAVTVRQVMERADALNSEHGLTVRQIIERAEAANSGQQENAETNSQTAAQGPVQGAIMTFTETGAMRVVPVRSRTTGAPHAGNAANDANATALLTRYQQEVEAHQQRERDRANSQSASPGTSTVGANVAGQETIVSLPPAIPQTRPQMHIQSWAPFIQALDAGFPQLYMQSGGELGQPQNGEGQTPDVGGQTGLNGEGSPPMNTNSSPQLENQREMNAELRAITDNLVRGSGVSQQDVHEIADSLGPLLNQMVAAILHSRSPEEEAHVEQVNGQPSVTHRSTVPESGSARASNARTDGAQPSNLHAEGDGSQVLPPGQVDGSGIGTDVQTGEKMDVAHGSDSASESRGRNSIEPNCGRNLPEGSRENERESPPESRDDQAQVRAEDRTANPPLGLGLGGLQPLPSRARRRGQGQPRQAQFSSTGPAAVAGSGQSAPRGNEQMQAPSAAQNLLQSLVSRVDRPNDTSDGSAMEQSLGQLTQGLLPLLGNLGNLGTSQSGEGGNLGDLMGQLMSRGAGEGNSGQAQFPSGVLRGMMGQIVQSPFMENLMQQVMTGARNEDNQNSDQPFSGLSGEGGFDFGGAMQQMLPVISQMFGGRQNTSSGQQAPSTQNVMTHSDDGAARDSPGQTNDTGRWREALSEEEAAQWSETISADVEQQQSAAPQRPFSDVYVRGSPAAKRQKTDLEGTAQKLENGGAPEEVLRSVAENVATQIIGTNGSPQEEASELAQQVAETDGLAEAYMAVLFHDLAARVAADPDFGDGSRFPNAARVFKQSKTAKEPDGG